jgi:SAM-dependent methyltransferase
MVAQGSPSGEIRERTAQGFAYEWEHFGELRPEWRKNFLDYMQPLTADWFADKLILDVGAGSGRHSAQAANLGARVVAIDLGDSIDVARRNLPDDALTVQADAERLPLSPDSFDLVMAIGVLHHLEDPQGALNSLVRYVRPGGHLHVYLYWVPEIRWHRPVLKLVGLARRATVKLPYRVVHRLSYPLAVGLWFGVVLPYRILRSHPGTARIAKTLPLKTYADYPFGVLVNDQFDRFSAPIERRFTRTQVHVMLERAGLEEVVAIPNHGWIGDGRRPVRPRQSSGGRVSVVVTVRNDRDGLRELLPALAAQTVKPDEVIIVDGGSVDGTLDALRGFRIPGTAVRTTVAPGANIAAGRNIGIGLARNELIACTDAGCRPDPGWLAALRQQLDKADIVGGVFVAEGDTELEKVLSLTYYPVPYELDRPGLFVRLSHRLFGRRYLASLAGGRSMAFDRSVWRAGGGFPEVQYAGEDQAFTRAVVDEGFKAALAREAVVRWRPRGTYVENARMFYRYSRGDVRSKGRSRHVARLLAWSLGPAAVVRGPWPPRALTVAGAAAYVALPMQRARLAGLGPRSWWRIPVAVAVKDLSQIAGAVQGTFDAMRRIPQPNPQPPPGPEVQTTVSPGTAHRGP